MRAAWVILLVLPVPALGQGAGIGLVCGGTVALDSATASSAAPGEALVVIRNMVGWPVRYRQAVAAVPPAVEQQAAPPLAGRGGALPPGLPFDIPPELLDRALTERLFPSTPTGGSSTGGSSTGGPATRGGAAGARTPPPPADPSGAPAAVARPPPGWRWLLPGEAVTLRVAPGPGGPLQRLGLQCDGGVTPPLAAPAPPR